MFEWPGKLVDPLASPHTNKEQGHMAYEGVLPLDLSLMVKAHHAGMDYLFSLLTGYCDPPAGMEILMGLIQSLLSRRGHCYCYAPPLNGDGVEYEDGTHATISQ